MEVQMTDFENAAFTAFIVLVTRALLVFDLCLLNGEDAPEDPGALCEEMTMDEVINGKGSYFPGLVPLCYAYLEHIQCDPTSYPRIQQYLNFISLRAEGKLLTPAAWMRNFVRSHP